MDVVNASCGVLVYSPAFMILINCPWNDGKLSLGEIQTHDIAITGPALYHMGTSALLQKIHRVPQKNM